jgi:hypothetical protein
MFSISSVTLYAVTNKHPMPLTRLKSPNPDTKLESRSERIPMVFALVTSAYLRNFGM